MPSSNRSQTGLHVIAKPIGPICNLNCAYCFYLSKESLYDHQGAQWRMTDETLDAFVRQYLEAQPETAGEIDFAFQGGEPTLLGVDFFRRAVELQRKHNTRGKRIRNSLQTNGILLDDRWCEFLRENDFLVGISIDGPADLHNKYRRDKQGRGTFDRVMEAVHRMRRYGVEFNALTCVNNHNGDHPVRVYRFLRDNGIQFMQFIPIVERLPAGRALADSAAGKPVTDRSVRPEQYGGFLTGVFDEWVHNDVGRVFVRDFDQSLAAWAGVGATLCVYSEFCGRATAIEHNGDLYACDHFVDPEHKLGNILETPIQELANSSRQIKFGRDKHEGLTRKCRECPVLFICNGGCPKDRILESADGGPSLNYLCEGFRAFFDHIDPYMKAMAAELEARRPAANVMHRLRAERQRNQKQAGDTPVRRNDPCPCGSGKKYKHCCMRRS